MNGEPKEAKRMYAYEPGIDDEPAHRVLVVKRGKTFGHIVSWTTSCSGCCETLDGHNVNGLGYDPKHQCLIGVGCDECGYTGKRRVRYWLPLSSKFEQRRIAKRYQQRIGERDV